MEFVVAGMKPQKASGTRWVTHKVNAIKEFVNKWGIYL